MIELLLNHKELIGSILAAVVYELFARMIPSKKNITIINSLITGLHFVAILLDQAVKNKKKGDNLNGNF